MNFRIARAGLAVFTLAGAAALLPSVSLAQPEAKPVKPAAQAASADAIGLAVGDQAPDASLVGADGVRVTLKEMVAKGPLVVVFYRGGWCPFCDKHLAAWGAQLDAIKAAGGTIIAISPEKVEALKTTADKTKTSYMLLSDSKLEAAKAFKLAFDLDQTTMTKYKGYGIDLAAHNASGTWSLPHPATYVIDREGVIRYAHADKDYTKRADPKEAMDILKTLAAK